MTALDLPGLGPSPARRASLQRHIRLLVAATITYNVIEAVVAITAGAAASSAALIGFGLDSVVEVASAAAVAWQFSVADHEAREKTALRVIAISSFALAAYVTFDAGRALLGAGEAEHSTPGLILAALSLLVMPFLSAAQLRAGRELGSASAVADSKQTLLRTYLSPVLLTGLALSVRRRDRRGRRPCRPGQGRSAARRRPTRSRAAAGPPGRRAGCGRGRAR
ncbi:cobalt transporter [Nonomuraea sp. LPB2021202275-12-8]|uniref:cobalt transporter n=1 Tax=Nonomuraea sp. LPB2021202275-12-8 TaxID=3120159 RepID=UPI00300D1BED